MRGRASSRSDFYVGYAEHAPHELGRWTRRGALGLVLGGLVVAILGALFHRRLDPSTFEFGVRRSFEGVVRMRPAPELELRRPRSDEVSRYLLVHPGKWGAAAPLSVFDNRAVRLEGSLVYRDGQTLIEVVPESVRELEAGGMASVAPDPSGAVTAAQPRGEADALEPRSLGLQTLVGEVVDSKCFLGVMNPGELKPHRACAARCIAGGIPPVLCVRDGAAGASYVLLVSAAGEPINEEVLEYVAETVEITGDLLRYGDRLVLRADIDSYRRQP